MNALIILVYWLSMAALSVYGVMGLYTLWQYRRHRRHPFPCPPLPDDPPAVTIQLPLYNEPFVVKSLIHAAVKQQYPSHCLQIQVIDDSTDATTSKAALLIENYQNKGVNICLVHRDTRTGYKAGALANAQTTATGEFIAIFDADFQPEPDFLRHTIPHFLADNRLGVLQTRWGHLNHNESVLTAVQAIALDKHFIIEQTVRHRANLFPKFNGAGGVWRRACLEDAGGWQTDTVCEDLCLSTRALLKGWQFHFLPNVISPAELPATISAYKIQQARWAKGSCQCLWKYGYAILSAPEQSLAARLYALLTMSAYLTHFLVIGLLLLQIPLIVLEYRPPAWAWLFTLPGLGQPLLFIVSQQVLHRNWVWRLRHLPTLLLVAIGLAPAVTRAILQVAYGRHHPFIRTPKRGNAPAAINDAAFDWLLLVELFLALYAFIAAGMALYYHNTGPFLFLMMCTLGLGYVAGLSLRDIIDFRRTPHHSSQSPGES